MPQARDEHPASRDKGREDAPGDHRRAQGEADRLAQGAAQADRDSKLHESRKGVNAPDKLIADMNAVVKDGLGKRFKRLAERIILRKNGVTR